MDALVVSGVLLQCAVYSGGHVTLFFCSVQKLSEFFSSEEIGEEQDPSPAAQTSSTNHKYQAVVRPIIITPIIP